MQSKSGASFIKGLRDLRSLASRGPSLTVSSAAYSTTPSDIVLVKMHSPHVAEFILNQPKKLNSLDIPMIDIMVRELKKWKTTNSQPQALIVSGAGGKAFCAGGDIVSIFKLKGKVGLSERAKFFYKEYLLDHELATTKSTEIALWNGIVMGGGVGISMQAPIRIATEKSVFAMPQATIGFFCDVGGSYFLPRILNNPAYGLYLGLSSERFKGKELLSYGVATHFIQTERIEALKADLNKNVTQDSNQEEILKIVERHCSSQGFEGLDQKKREEIESVYQLDSCEGIIARAKQLALGGNEVAKRAVKVFPRMSPLAMKIIFQQIKRGAKMSYSECMRMEYDIAQSCMDESVSDFFEGVRALLVDKDNKPKWHYEKLEKISEEAVELFFEPKTHKLNLDLLKYQQ